MPTEAMHLGNNEILAAIKLALSTKIEYSLSVNYDAEGNPIMTVAPITKITSHNSAKRK